MWDVVKNWALVWIEVVILEVYVRMSKLFSREISCPQKLNCTTENVHFLMALFANRSNKRYLKALWGCQFWSKDLLNFTCTALMRNYMTVIMLSEGKIVTGSFHFIRNFVKTYSVLTSFRTETAQSYHKVGRWARRQWGNCAIIRTW